MVDQVDKCIEENSGALAAIIKYIHAVHSREAFASVGNRARVVGEEASCAASMPYPSCSPHHMT